LKQETNGLTTVVIAIIVKRKRNQIES
jgi:hypothetical protein